MEIKDFYAVNDKEYWLEKIKDSDWSAGRYLYELLKEQKLKQLVGEKTRLLMLINGKDLVSFCTFAEKDDIQPTELTPWIGWVYTFPEYRGNHYAGELLKYAEKLAQKEKIRRIHISTDHIGLYEKYGYEFLRTMQTIGGESSRVYVKYL